MMDPEALHVLEDIVTAGIVGTTIIFIAYSPIMRAFANRIRHGKVAPPGAPSDDSRIDLISSEMEALRHHLDETMERLEFTERMLAQARERGVLPGAKS